MKSSLVNLTYEIELQPGETLTLPQSLVEQVGAGSWIITIQSGEFWIAEIPFTNGVNSKIRFT
jgi:hypothetical protein